ncbi:Vacuolar ATPase assembly integral membrane protein VMA21 [Blattella germanica]|nr:Vacuolar ATPase assembly integral membrane protein VMA21 [Blattella germanica]
MNEKTVEQPEFQTFRVVFYYIFVLIVVPILAFFGAKNIVFDGVLGLPEVKSNVYSAILTVVILHIVLGFFIRKAFSGGDLSAKPVKQD